MFEEVRSQAWDKVRLNESPSEKEGKSSPPDPQHPQTPMPQ